MEPRLLAVEVDSIIARGGDPEAAHAAEDALMVRLLMIYLPPDVLAEVERLWDADLPRWRA